MNEILDLAQKFAPLVASLLVPLIGGVLLPLLAFKREPRDPAAVRSMNRHAKLHDALPEGSRESIQRLLEFEASKYARTLMRRGTRKVDGSKVAAVIFVAAMGSALEYVLIYVAFVWWPAFILAGLVFGFGAALLSVGVRQIFVYEDADHLASGDVALPDLADEKDVELSSAR